MPTVTHGTKSYNFEEPELCPHCEKSINPKLEWHEKSKNAEGEVILMSIWRCPSVSCKRLIVCEHLFSDEIFYSGPFGDYYNAPVVNIKKPVQGGSKWPEFIKELKSGFSEESESKFISAYKQSIEAESFGLKEIAGLGFRKSLEYLVKDLVAKKLKQEGRLDELKFVKESQLWPVIDKYFDNDLKNLLQKAAWLGNDQAHYFRIYEEFDIDELKEIIELIVSDLDREIRKKRFLDLESRKQKNNNGDNQSHSQQI